MMKDENYIVQVKTCSDSLRRSDCFDSFCPPQVILRLKLSDSERRTGGFQELNVLSVCTTSQVDEANSCSAAQEDAMIVSIPPD